MYRYVRSLVVAVALPELRSSSLDPTPDPRLNATS